MSMEFDTMKMQFWYVKFVQELCDWSNYNKKGFINWLEEKCNMFFRHTYK